MADTQNTTNVSNDPSRTAQQTMHAECIASLYPPCCANYLVFFYFFLFSFFFFGRAALVPAYVCGEGVVSVNLIFVGGGVW